MKAILKKDKCLVAIGERPAEVTDDSKWDEMDGNAIANLHLALADERKLYALRIIESTLVTEHVNNLNTLLSQLTSLDCKIDLQERAEILLHSLPDSYDQVIINLTSNFLTDCLVFDDVVASILEEQNRYNNRDDRQTNSRHVEALVVMRRRSMKPGSNRSHNHGKSKTGKKKNFKCFKCGKPATVTNEDRKRFVDVWLFDTGATFHMTARREWFHQYKPISEGGSIYNCNDYELKIIGIGSVMAKMHNGIVRTIRDMRHVKGLKKNLLSLGQLDDLGCKKLGHMSEQGMKTLVERKLIPGITKARRNQKAVPNDIHSLTEWSGRADEQNLVRKSKSNVGNCKLGKIVLGGRWKLDYVMESNVAYCLHTEEGEPSTLQEALNNPDVSF
ncbi:hypothetical protein Tco_1314689 [Tanacetum coccineum]